MSIRGSCWSAFSHCCSVLWRDKLGQISLAVTTLFWGAGATLQFIVLKWAEQVLGLDLSRAAILQAVVGSRDRHWSGLRRFERRAEAVHAGPADRRHHGRHRRAGRVLYAGLAPAGDVRFGFASMSWFLLIACVILVLIGGLAGYFVVPMNALLQHRGHVLLSAGHSIAVQNFNENLSILVMLGLYALLVWFDLSIRSVMLLFGLFVAVSMVLVHPATPLQPAAVRFGRADRPAEALRVASSRGRARMHLARKAEVGPRLGLVAEVSQQVGRVICHHHRHAPAGNGDVMHLPAQAGNAGVGTEERLCREAAHHQDQLRIDQFDLTPAGTARTAPPPPAPGCGCSPGGTSARWR